MKSDDGLRVGDELRKFIEQEKKQRHLKERLAKRQRKEWERDDLWRSAWEALAGKDAGPEFHWTADGPALVRTLARQQHEIERDRVRTIRQRLGKWLRRKDRHELASPLIALKPLSGNPADEGFISNIKGVFVAAAILEGSYDLDAEPLVPEDIDTFDLRSWSWLNLWHEVLREDGRPIEPGPPDRKVRCGNGHEWESNAEPGSPIRCTICESEYAERQRQKMAEATPPETITGRDLEKLFGCTPGSGISRKWVKSGFIEPLEKRGPRNALLFEKTDSIERLTERLGRPPAGKVDP
jgi:hypothetical protein